MASWWMWLVVNLYEFSVWMVSPFLSVMVVGR